jgi:anaerobic magnesium-protoporphyrin IX monomethyl ester cyclase
MKPLKILFVQLGFDKLYPDVSTLATTYNDGLYYVASFLKRELPGADIQVCQMFWGEDPADFPLEQYDYILISALATHFWSSLETLALIRSRKSPGCKIIMGGPHATFAPHEVLRYADFAILGEGEIPALNLLTVLETGGDLEDVENLCYRSEDGGLVINQLTRFGSLDVAIDPALLEGAPRLHWATVSMSRGCPFDCSFCYAIRVLGRRFRPKEVTTIVDELDGIHRQTGCSRFYVTDLNFTTRADFCHSVADSLRGRPYHFIAMSRIELADKLDLLLHLKASGFREYCLGVESEDEGVLRSFNKRVDASQQTERLRRFAEQDINIHSAIIFGLESQDLAAIERTAHWCAEARIVHPTFVCLAEYPFQKLLYGSRQDVEDHRVIPEVPTYQHYSFVGIFPRHMRPSTLQRAILKSYEIFFARALEIETRPQRRMRLKSYAYSVDVGRAGMERHIAFLEELERPYYSPSGVLKEDLLKADFDTKYGELRKWLETSVQRHGQLVEAFKT